MLQSANKSKHQKIHFPFTINYYYITIENCQLGNNIDKIMIKGKYKVIETLKDVQYKIVQKAKYDNTIFFLKSYALSQGKLIHNEIQTYEKLKQPHLHGFPEIKEAFQEESRVYLVLQQLGESVQTLRIRCGGRLGLKTVLMIGLQALERIQYLHKSEILHGDIKPSNFLIGKGKMKHKIYLTDFELSTPYCKQGKHIAEEARERFSGSLRFSSRAVNAKSTLSRRDEIESLFYSLIFLLKGQLPWMSIKAKNMKDAIDQVLEIKIKSRTELLAGLPEGFKEIANHIDELKFASSPGYVQLKNILQGMMKKNGYELDYKYDWQYI